MSPVFPQVKLNPSSPNLNKISSESRFHWRDQSPGLINGHQSGEVYELDRLTKDNQSTQKKKPIILKQRQQEKPGKNQQTNSIQTESILPLYPIHSSNNPNPTFNSRENGDQNSVVLKTINEEESTNIPQHRRLEISWIGDVWPDIYKEIEFIKLIGQGSFAKVYSASDLQSKRKVAVKVVDKRKVTEINCRKMIDKELEIISSIDHPNIVKFHRLIEDKKRVDSGD